jgi:hypothetical protein
MIPSYLLCASRSQPLEFDLIHFKSKHVLEEGGQILVMVLVKIKIWTKTTTDNYGIEVVVATILCKNTNRGIVDVSSYNLTQKDIDKINIERLQQFYSMNMQRQEEKA